MFTIRNIGGVALFLFGTTYLWVTPEFVSEGHSRSGALWALTRILALATMAGFTVATWGLFHRSGWWESLAIASAALGTVVLVPYWFAARHAGEPAPGFNVAIHLLGNVGVFALLLVPSLERWVSSHVTSGH